MLPRYVAALACLEDGRAVTPERLAEIRTGTGDLTWTREAVRDLLVYVDRLLIAAIALLASLDDEAS